LSKGIYNETYFENNPEERDREGVLYGIVLVNTKTFERECIKVGIASGKDWRHIIKSAAPNFLNTNIISFETPATLYNVPPVFSTGYSYLNALSFKCLCIY
jgi:hypothetical protein